MKCKLRLGMVGGGPGSFIGPVHRMAAELDGEMALVAGVFSRDSEKSRLAGDAYSISQDRVYPTFAAMFEAERNRVDGIDVVAITTPNHMHLPIAIAALDAGIHVISDKPATATLAEALQLREVVQRSGRVYALTYTYTGYPMIRRAREMVRSGELGKIRKVVIDYPQGWLADPIEHSGNQQAEWRADPARAGSGGCIADIGVHAFNLAEYVTGERVTGFIADLQSLVLGRTLDDDCSLLLRFTNGISGTLWASQIATGERNNLKLRIYGDKAGLTWSHEQHDQLIVSHSDGSVMISHAGVGSKGVFRLPAGHPEGFVEAFARIYSDVARAIRGERGLLGSVLPDIDDGVRSMEFVEAAVAAGRSGSVWTSLGGA